MTQRLIPLLLVLVAVPALAEEVTIQDISKLEAETLLSEYVHCNGIGVSLSPVMADVVVSLSGRPPSERDQAIAAAMSCHKEWVKLVEELAFNSGFEEALRIGLEVQDRMIEQNVIDLRSLPEE